jgi:histone deacetylase HOS2
VKRSLAIRAKKAEKADKVTKTSRQVQHSQHRASFFAGLLDHIRDESKNYPTETPSSFSHFETADPVLPPPAMGFPGARPSNVGNNIVEEYLSPNDAYYVEDYSAFKSLTDAEKVEVIAREAEEHGLEKPQGWNVSFHYNPHVEYHHFGSSHPMKPWRLTLTKQLVVAYGLEYTMDLYTPRPANFAELALFHDREYLSYLSK